MLKTNRSILRLKKKLSLLEHKKKINKFLHIFLNNYKKNDILSSNFFISNKKEIKISKTKIKPICSLTSRTKSINKHYNVSRIVFREMLSFGIFPGYKKAVW